MSYESVLTSNNVAVALHSPRKSGETAARSPWQEVPYSVFENMTVRQRAKLADALAGQYKFVWIRVSTICGHARIYCYTGEPTKLALDNTVRA